MAASGTSAKRIALIATLGLVLLGLYTWVFHNMFAVRAPGAVDFYVYYEGTRLYLGEGLNPYSEELVDRVHANVFGSQADTLDPQHAFFYPLYTVLLIAPYILLPTYAWVQAAWQVTLQVLLVASVILTLRYFDWRPSLWLLALVIVWSVLLYPSARAILLGQFSVVVFFLTVLAFWLLFRGDPSPWRDVAAGACLALSTVKPQMQFLIIPLLLLWALRERRWHFIASAALSMALLLGISFLMIPTWLTDWLRQVGEYGDSAAVYPPVLHIATHDITQLGDAVMWALRLLLAGWLLMEWWLLLRHGSSERLDWALALTLVLTHLLAPRTATTSYIVFIPALVLILRRLAEAHVLAALGVMAILLAGNWWLFMRSVVGNAEATVMFIPLPLITLLLLVLARRSLLQPPSASGTGIQRQVTA